MKSKILFIDVYLDIVTWEMFYNPGVASISAVLKQNHIKSEHFAVFKQSDIQKLLTYIKDNHFDIVGFTVTEPILKSVSKIVSIIKKKFPKIYIVCGGLQAILDPKVLMDKVNCDAVCIGEGEYSTLKLIQSLEKKSPNIYKLSNFWFRKNSKIIKNPLDKPIDINTLPDPNREIFYKSNLDLYFGNIYLKGGQRGCIVTLSRGCYFNCTFCANQFLNTRYGGDYRRVLNPKKAIDQLTKILSKRSYDYIIFIDPQFPTDDLWLKKFTDLYIKKIKLPFTIQIRFASFTKKTVNLLKKAGCYFTQIGLESGDKDIRFRVLNKRIDHQMIIDGVEMFKQKNIKIGLNNMVGLPDETPARFINTIQTNAYLSPDYSYIFVYYPYKGTELYQYCLKHNLINKNVKYFSGSSTTTLKLKNFPRKDILFYYDNYQSLLSIFKKSLTPHKTKAFFWRKIFNFYSIPPSKRHGIIGLFSKTSEKLFFEKYNHL